MTITQKFANDFLIKKTFNKYNMVSNFSMKYALTTYRNRFFLTIQKNAEITF